jgi:glyoxylase-like metal-dependent hydrolase (beta-lactamase superfamily II)/ferredoxin
MANPRKLVRENVAGEFFVDTSCIDCDTCRQLAPQVFGESAEFSFVAKQPHDELEERDALRALVCCPTGSIGTQSKNGAREVQADFPLRLEENVFYCGFNSPKSYGGNSYFIQHPYGNWLIDSPKFLPRLVKRFAEMGGIASIFLTHRDNVADADRYAREFGCDRVIHEAELSSQPDAEIVLEGLPRVQLASGLLAIPTPGHTEGHCVLLYDDRYLFTGDHLSWDREGQRLSASQDYCWHSWHQQTSSMARLLDYSFEWVLPGHGQRVHLPCKEMRQQLYSLVERMYATT